MLCANTQNIAGQPAYRGEVKAKRPDVQTAVAVNLRALMEKREWTQTVLAKKAVVSQRHVSNVLNGQTGCGIQILDAIASAFELPGWVLMIPGFHVDILDSQAITELIDHYRDAGPEGRQLIDRLAEREAHHNPTKAAKLLQFSKAKDR